MRPAIDWPRLAEVSDGTAAGLRTLVEIVLTECADNMPLGARR